MADDRRVPHDFDSLALNDLRRRIGIKWALAEGDVIPAWIADMDFAVAPPIRAALHDLVERGELGYPAWVDSPTPLRPLFARRMSERHGWQAEPDHFREFDDLIHALVSILDVATKPGEVIAAHTPGYPPFLGSLTNEGRSLLPIPLELTKGGWTFDIDRLDAEVARTCCKTLLIVNPHNPTGRVFTRVELEGLADVASRRDLLVICDEVHAELVYAPNRHIPFASLSADAAARTVTLSSATKAFNVAGTCMALAHVGPRDVRAALDARPLGFNGARNVFGMVATEAAWTSGDGWLAELVTYLRGNRDLVMRELAARAPGVRVHEPEATYLAWLGFRDTRIGDDPAAALLAGGLMLLDGATMGPGGQGFARLNFATSRQVVAEMIDRLVAVV